MKTIFSSNIDLEEKKKKAKRQGRRHTCRDKKILLVRFLVANMPITLGGLYPILLGASAEAFGFLSVILVGLFFLKDGPAGIYDWKSNPFAYHPLMMTLGLLFCYGNAILLYRTFRSVPKLMVKILHAVFLIVSLLLAVVGFVAIIRSKNLGKRSHFMTYHSWLGLTTLILFALQWICGFTAFLFPQLSLEMRKAYMPSHRLWGKVIFMSAVIAILTGISEHGATSSFFPLAGDVQRNRRLIMNFACVFTSLFSLIVIYLLSNPEYQRPPEHTVEITQSYSKEDAY